jgi:alkanesulfonate monooxygenase SsuD/methylene tetrahydromethanopterin reductase-like flavin-dependent oxidoreductase (luciferase family)
LDRVREGFDVAPTAPVVVTDDLEAGREALKQYYSFYVGGMGARGKNFYNDLMARYGWEGEARAIQDAFLDGRQRDAAALVPDAFVDEVALVGPKERIRDRLDAWRQSGATMLVASTRDAASLRALAEVAL